MLNIKNVVKSNKMMQVYDIASVTNNTGRCVDVGVTTHSQYNNDVSQIKAQYIFDTVNNVDLFNATDENVDFTRFKTIGAPVVISGCITMHDIIDFYASGCIQQFYECFCESHSNEESITLARFLSAIGIEVWRKVECYGGIYSGRYMVSNMANVLSLNTNKILKPYDNTKGYLRVRLHHENQPKDVYIHRLMALTFYGVPTEKMDACHANGNTLDNRLFNIDLKTHTENMLNPITLKKYKDTWTTKARTKADKATTESTASTAPTPTTASE